MMYIATMDPAGLAADEKHLKAAYLAATDTLSGDDGYADWLDTLEAAAAEERV